MFFSSYQQIIRFGLIVLIFSVAVFTQKYFLVNWDVAYFIQAAERLLAGGQYHTDFFETNTPLIIYLSIIPLWLMQHLHLSIDLAVKGAVFALIILSLTLCSYFLQKAVGKEDGKLVTLLTLLISSALLLLPIYEFGQREHLLLILSFPYILLIAARIESSQPFTFRRMTLVPFLTGLAGVLAGIAFCLKPFFFITPLMLELLIIYQNKHVNGWRRQEFILLLLTSSLCMVLEFIFNPEYYFVMLPFISRLYFAGFREPLTVFLSNPCVIFSGAVLALYVASYKIGKSRAFGHALAITLLSLIIILMIEGNGRWYYHILPIFAVSLILGTLQVRQILNQRHNPRIETWLLLLLSACFFITWSFATLWVVIIFAPKLYFSYFAGIFLLLVYFANHNLWRSLIYVAIIITISYLFSYLVQHDTLYSHLFLFTTTMLFMLLGVFIPFGRYKINYMGVCVLITAIYYYPVNLVISKYLIDGSEKKFLITLLNNIAQDQSVIMYSSRNSNEIFYYTKTKNASRFPSFWPLPGLIARLKYDAAHPKRQTAERDKSFFVSAIAEDLVLHKPKYVFVDRNDTNLPQTSSHLDYLKLFTQDKKFLHEWQHYKFVKQFVFGPDVPIKLDMYERS